MKFPVAPNARCYHSHHENEGHVVEELKSARTKVQSQKLEVEATGEQTYGYLELRKIFLNGSAWAVAYVSIFFSFKCNYF